MEFRVFSEEEAAHAAPDALAVVEDVEFVDELVHGVAGLGDGAQVSHEPHVVALLGEKKKKKTGKNSGISVLKNPGNSVLGAPRECLKKIVPEILGLFPEDEEREGDGGVLRTLSPRKNRNFPEHWDGLGAPPKILGIFPFFLPHFLGILGGFFSTWGFRNPPTRGGFWAIFGVPRPSKPPKFWESLSFFFFSCFFFPFFCPFLGFFSGFFFSTRGFGTPPNFSEPSPGWILGGIRGILGSLTS